MNHPHPAAPDAMPSGTILGVMRPRTIPAVIKRNTLLLASAQAFVGVGNQMVPTLGAIMVHSSSAPQLSLASLPASSAGAGFLSPIQPAMSPIPTVDARGSW